MYFKELSYAFSIPTLDMLVLIAIVIGMYIYNMKRNDNSKQNIYKSILIIPVVLYFLTICKIAPNMGKSDIIRYIAIILPSVSIIIIITLEQLLSKMKDKKIVISMILMVVIGISIFGILINEPRYLYKGYKEILEIAKKNKETDFIYICDNNFTYLSVMPEFLEYNKSLIININEDNLEHLKNDTELKQKEEIIISIRKYLNYKEVLEKIKENTGFKNHIVLKNIDSRETIIYKLTKK